MAVWYLQILWLHIGCAIISGGLFTLRGGLVLAGHPVGDHVLFRRTATAVDTLLLAAGLALSVIIHQYPFVQAWLTVKILLLLLYIVLGSIALRRGRRWSTRATCFVSAIAVYLFIVSIAYAHSPLGILVYIR